MSQFEKDARDLLTLVGGKDNIAAVTHCATRMRFALVDPNIAKVDEIEKLPAVKGTFTQAGQFQVIIGNTVSEFYKDFVQISGVNEASKEEVKKASEKNQNKFQQAMTFLSEIFAPIIPAIIVGGLILGFRNILGGVGFQSLGQKVVDGVAMTTAAGEPIYNSIVDVSQFWNGVNHFLWLPGEAIFHFLPVGIVWAVTRKMGTTQILGIILGLTLVSPQLLNAYGAADALASGTVPQWDFGFIKINMIGYQAQVIPAMLAGITLSYFERFWRRVVPEMLSMILVPFLALVPAVILAHTVLGPIGWWLGNLISSVVLSGLNGSFKWLFGALFGALYSPLVITGLHHMTNAIDSQLIADSASHTTGLWPMIALSNIAQASAVVGYWWMTRHNEEESQITIPSFVSAYLGVTEPALFGVTLKYVYPFVAAMIGSGIAGLLCTTFNVQAVSIGVGGLPGFLVITKDTIGYFFLCMAVAIAVPIILTLSFKRLNLFTGKKS